MTGGRWWEGRMLGLDLETTAADPELARMVSVALVWCGGGEETRSESFLVNPGVEIPEGATEVHGITNEMARERGVPASHALLRIMVDVKAAIALGVPLVAFNASYDLTVCDREFRRLGADHAADLLGALLVFDPIVAEKHLDRYRPKRVASHSLEDACRVWNVVLDGAHDAAFDAIAACRLAYRLAQNGRVIRRTRDEQERREFIELSQEWEAVRHDIVALQRWQRRIRREEAIRLQEYFRVGDPQKGVPPQPDRVVPTDWPIIPHARSITAVSSTAC